MHNDRTMPKVPGAHGEPMHLTRITSVRSCRLSASKRPTIREKMTARPCGGFVQEAHPMKPVSKNARRKAQRYGKGL